MLIKDMTDAGLWDHYRATRALLANADGIASLNAQVGARRTAAKAVGQVFKFMKQLDITVAVARRRGIDLTGPRPVDGVGVSAV